MKLNKIILIIIIEIKLVQILVDCTNNFYSQIICMYPLIKGFIYSLRRMTVLK